jgi:hypothetical protein
MECYKDDPLTEQLSNGTYGNSYVHLLNWAGWTNVTNVGKLRGRESLYAGVFTRSMSADASSSARLCGRLAASVVAQLTAVEAKLQHAAAADAGIKKAALIASHSTTYACLVARIQRHPMPAK